VHPTIKVAVNSLPRQTRLSEHIFNRRRNKEQTTILKARMLITLLRKGNSLPAPLPKI
jgi:hypothetical protein